MKTVPIPFAAALALAVVLAGCNGPGKGPGIESPAALTFDGAADAGPERTFAVRYVVTVKDIPAGARRLRLWWPVPRDSELQAISELKFSGPAEPRIGKERRFGDPIAHVDLRDPPGATEFAMEFVVRRREAKVGPASLGGEGVDRPETRAPFADPGRLVVVDDEIRRLAETATRGEEGVAARARALYDLVLSRMTYDKTGKGWGRGDSRYACEVGKGNCTDFHALFAALCKAVGIDTAFQIGLYLPYERDASGGWAAGSGYHCWAAFRVPGRAWVPVDISEADKNPDRAEFFFGGYTANRVALSTGRDLVLDPPQDGEPLNYFIDPYAEVDGIPHPGATRNWSFRDL